MADDGVAAPVWERGKRRGGGAGLFRLLMGLLALFGLVVTVLGVKEKSFEKAGAAVDRGVAVAAGKLKAMSGKALAGKAEAGANKVEAAADTAGDAVKAGAEKVDAAADKVAKAAGTPEKK